MPELDRPAEVIRTVAALDELSVSAKQPLVPSRQLDLLSGEVGDEELVYSDMHARLRGDYSRLTADGELVLFTGLPWDAWDGQLRWLPAPAVSADLAASR